MKYLLWSKLYKQWYCKPGAGMTLDLERAGRYDIEEAESLSREVGFEVFKKASNGPLCIVLFQVPEGEK